MKHVLDPAESDLLEPVLRLFPKRRFHHLFETALGRKRIDLLCLPHALTEQRISVELKVRDWRKALWQAAHNFHAAEQSYIAIWHRYVPVVERNIQLLDTYGVGLIAVDARRAELIRPSTDRVHRIARAEKQRFYQFLASSC